MACFFKKLFGRKEDTVASQTPSPTGEAEKKLDDIRNAIMDLRSKGKSISVNRENLRAEIRQKEVENQKLMDEYVSLPDGLEKEMVMGMLESNENVLNELLARVNGLNKAWGDNERVLQVMMRARERLEAAISAGKSPEDLAMLLDEISREGANADIGTGLVIDAAGNLDVNSTAVSDNREKVMARLAARKRATVSPPGNSLSDVKVNPVEDQDSSRHAITSKQS